MLDSVFIDVKYICNALVVPSAAADYAADRNHVLLQVSLLAGDVFDGSAPNGATISTLHAILHVYLDI